MMAIINLNSPNRNEKKKKTQTKNPTKQTNVKPNTRVSILLLQLIVLDGIDGGDGYTTTIFIR